MRMVVRSMRLALKRAATKYWSFSLKGAELGGAQVFLVQAPSGVLRFAARGCGVGVLDDNEPVAPARWPGRTW